MRTRYGSERLRAASAIALAAVLAFALIGAVPSAFAEEGDEVPAADVEAPENDGEEGGAPLASAFRLGDVKLRVVAEDTDAAALALGIVTDRTYLITNDGEPAYLRLASSLVYGDLEQPSELDVSDTPDGARPSEEEDDVPTCPWRLAKDGWWYRDEPLMAGESIVVRVPVEIPLEDEWVAAFKTGAPSEIEEKLHVEAVQARNMRVDLSLAHPWGDVEVEVAGGSGLEGDGVKPSGPEEEGGLA